MQFKTNISALLVAIVVFFSTNGIFIFEHVCNSAQTRNFSVLKQTSCEMEKNVGSCCKKIQETKKKNCCEHKQFYSKLSYDGLLSKVMDIKPLIKLLNESCFFTHNVPSFSTTLISSASGLSPPDYIREIKPLLLPTQADLQVYRC